MDRDLGLWLGQLWQAIEHVHRLVLPATLVAGCGIDLIHGGPEPHSTIPDSQFRYIHPSTFEGEQNFAPALDAFAHPVLNGQKTLLATGRDPNNHKGTELVILTAQTAVDTIRPDIDNWFVIQICAFPARVFFGPIALKPRHRIC
ncbi:hypothetical protein PFRI_14290 [Planktotalea frisia]|uniref:Uncharacterized protein n=1 Tax=Planktotalea frisia TaxID=696762 RepID=A0A1L9NYM0_9RHOB|nr:hypothetical protein PFRI_14290 [Planktotalea frisia]